MNHLIIFAHPNSERSFGRAIANRIEQISQANGVNVFFRDLYEMNFNSILSFEELRNAHKGIIPEDIKQEHNFILQADLITLVYPLWWMGFPAILKGYLDRVLSHGFAYKTENGESVGLLKNKQMLQFITIGSNLDKYKEFGVDKSLNHCLINGLFNYCGIENVEFELFGDIHLIDDGARKAMIELAAQKTKEKLTALLKEKA
ncbi:MULTISPECIES: NAD(P)H-dependent oxidoreductase [Haemophilus]|uniref:NAD(P)H oxidoreductase n=1 Tax=Haemophilus aegyptius TaxID=197575 RepID=A0ABY1VV07_HAEAE|nr:MULTISPECIES: NAD(P)H-dependent oxidoreductase [Haemophilus]EGF15761.1 quinone family NAD(P)H2 dehydrogenase [Haemophilus aegyptius ATCC 11116]OBX84153.1 NAD(P)H oxidoreductase [Haemophilus aegyptius]TMQ42713.1 NAD(P)H oxidoreductase [Haemophilus influenzae biotype aegyptius]UAK81959.1 NAD(P)H-dependent oxidoreductase [Haemophilus aegyptius]SQH37830.1 NAD(P)H oxidoreductase [Haemophilus aegyptius]